MIQVEPIQNFSGFGTGDTQGEYFYSQGMTKSRFGIVPGWVISGDQNNTTLTTLQLGTFFGQGMLNGRSDVVMLDSSGYIYDSQAGLNAYTTYYKLSTNNAGNGLIFDQKNRLLFFSNRYIGKIEGNTDYSTGTISVTNGSAAITGSGTTFTAPMAGKKININNVFYTILSYTSATSIILSTNYTGTTASGLTYNILNSVTEQWKDLGSSNDSFNFRQPDVYEDWVVFPVYNGFAALNVTDDSLANPGITMPTGYTPSLVSSGRNGILLGVNFNNRGFVALWDAQSPRSIAPWIWFNSNVKCIIPVPTTGAWIVITSTGIYNTNGYSFEPILENILDDRINEGSVLQNIKPQGAQIIGKYLAFLGTNYGYLNRNKDGLYLLDLQTKLFEFVPISNGVTRGVTGGAILFDSNSKIHVSYSTPNLSRQYIGSLNNNKGTSAYFITDKLGNLSNNNKTAEGFKLTLGISTKRPEYTPIITFNVTAKIYNFKRPLWASSQTNNASVTANVLRVNGVGYTAAQVGDEVTVLEGVNAGLVRHITSISGKGTTGEQWTLDSALPNLTESIIFLTVAPFQLIKKQVLTNLSEIRELYFDIKNKIAGKKFLVKILIDGMDGTTVTPEIHEAYFIYDDKGMF